MHAPFELKLSPAVRNPAYKATKISLTRMAITIVNPPIFCFHAFSVDAYPQCGQCCQSAWMGRPQLGQASAVGGAGGPAREGPPPAARTSQTIPATSKAKKLKGISHIKIVPSQLNGANPQPPIMPGPIIPL